jgi:stearoyl-CoA desaturase (delta-9 desaturase)
VDSVATDSSISGGVGGQTANNPAEGRWQLGLEWPAVIWITFLHLGALAAPFYFTWNGLLLAMFLSWVTGSLGVCLGFHRLLTHSSFETYAPLRGLFALCGTLAGEGPPIMWVSAHRKHHRFSDQDQDPHSPRHGAWWSHMFWMMPHFGSQHWAQLYRTYAPDLMKEPFMRLLNRTFLWWHLFLGVIVFSIGWGCWDLNTGISFVVWGMFVRLVYVLHITWCVNSASHMWGYKNYETRDDSRNLWWVGLIAFGEGWHNNHHAFQRIAQHGHRWWEIDVTYWVIAIMKKTGLAWNVVLMPKNATPKLDEEEERAASKTRFQIPSQISA